MMTLHDWFVFFREWRNGPITSALKATRIHYYPEGKRAVRLHPRWYQTDHFEAATCVWFALMLVLL